MTLSGASAVVVLCLLEKERVGKKWGPVSQQKNTEIRLQK